MNPTLPRDHPDIETAFVDDPAWAAAEYGANFAPISKATPRREAVEAVTDWQVFERPPAPGILYTGMIDPSGGSRDSMVAAIAHRQGEIGILDCVREFRPPF